MDKIEIIKEFGRMCDYFTKKSGCVNCEMYQETEEGDISCFEVMKANPEKVVEIVEKWAAENKAKTRQSEFLKMYPNATPFHIDPCNVDTDMAIDSKCRCKSCIECREEYWLAEVE